MLGLPLGVTATHAQLPALSRRRLDDLVDIPERVLEKRLRPPRFLSGIGRERHPTLAECLDRRLHVLGVHREDIAADPGSTLRSGITGPHSGGCRSTLKSSWPLSPTVTQRPPSGISLSSRISNPRVVVNHSSARSWSGTTSPTISTYVNGATRRFVSIGTECAFPYTSISNMIDVR